MRRSPGCLTMRIAAKHIALDSESNLRYT